MTEKDAQHIAGQCSDSIYPMHANRNSTWETNHPINPWKNLRRSRLVQRYVRVRQQRTRVDFAYVVKELCDDLYPDAEKIILVMDNLNTHEIASLYAAFEPVQARRLSEKLEIHYTPKHGSWLNMAEIELSILSRQCMNDYFDGIEKLSSAVGSWQQSRNEIEVGINWQFTTADARVKLRKLYPVI